MTVNLMCEPESKLGVWDRWLNKVYLPSCQDLKLDQMYEAMDLLQAHSTAVEEAVFFRKAHLFNLEVDLIFYDITTAAFAITAEGDDQGLRRFGRPKHGAWSPRVVIALAVTRDGLAGAQLGLSGTDRGCQHRSSNHGKPPRLEFDASPLCGRRWHELPAEPPRPGQSLRQISIGDPTGQPGRSQGRGVAPVGALQRHCRKSKGKEVFVDDGERRGRYIVCYNPLEAKRQQLPRYLEAEVAKHPDSRATARWVTDLLASGRYRHYLKFDEATKRLAINRQAAREAAHTGGKWRLITNSS